MPRGEKCKVSARYCKVWLTIWWEISFTPNNWIGLVGTFMKLSWKAQVLPTRSARNMAYLEMCKEAALAELFSYKLHLGLGFPLSHKNYKTEPRKLCLHTNIQHLIHDYSRLIGLIKPIYGFYRGSRESKLRTPDLVQNQRRQLKLKSVHGSSSFIIFFLFSSSFLCYLYLYLFKC